MVDVSGNGTGDGTEFDIAMICGDRHRASRGADMYVPVIRGYGGVSVRWNRDGQIGPGSGEHRHVENDVISVGAEFGGKALRLCGGIRVAAAVNLLVDGDVYLLVIAGAGDRDVAARVIDRKGSAGWKCLDDGLIALVLVA